MLKRKPIIDPLLSTTDREITSLLNKITKKNYAKLMRDVLRTTGIHNVDYITRCVLSKCQKQPGFLDLYTNILHDIYKCSQKDIKIAMQKVLSEYIEAFVETRHFRNFHLDSSDYKEFCSNLDAKNQIIGTHNTILAIINKILKNSLEELYFNIMFNELIQMDDELSGDVQVTCFERHELLLDIITDFVKADPRYVTHIEKYYATHDAVLGQYSLKAKFKVMNITEVVIHRR